MTDQISQMQTGWEAALEAARAARAKGELAAALASFAAVAAQLPEAAWPLVECGNLRRGLGQAAAAAADFHAALRLEPENIHALVGLAHLARGEGRHRQALALFTQVAGLAPEAEWARLEQATDMRALGELDAAEATLAPLAAAGNGYALLGRGQLAQCRGDAAAALALFAQASRAAPALPWPHLERAALLLALGRVDEAEAGYRAAAGLGADYVMALGLGRCALARGERAEALAQFETAARAAPEEPWPWLELAAFRREAGDLAAAQALARRALDCPGGALPGWRALAEIARAAADWPGAVAALREALARAPEDADLMVELALAIRALGQQDECDEWLARALAREPGQAAALTALAEQAMIAGALEQAAALYAQGAAAHPRAVQFQVGQLEVLAAQGEVTAALEGFAGLAAAWPDSPLVALKWSSLLRETGRYPEALAVARAAASRQERAFWVHVALLQAELVAGTDASFHAALARLPATSHAEQAARWRFLGQYAEAQGQLPAACRHYARAAVLNPQDAGVQYDLARSKCLLLDLTGAQAHLRRTRALDALHIRLRGYSFNVSQTHYGQIFDEFVIDAPLLASLRRLRRLNPAHRAAALAPLMRANPDSTAAAITLLLSLREAQALRAPPGEPGAIPRRLAQFWDQAQPPADILALMQGWAAQNPDYETRRFDAAAAFAFLRQHYPPAVAQAFARVPGAAQKADIFRLAWLLAEGGVYVDADDRALAPLASVLPAQASLVLYIEDMGTLGNNFIAVAPRHPLMHRALTLAVQAVNRGDSDIVWLSTGPALLTRAFAQLLAETPDLALWPGTHIISRRDMFRLAGLHSAVAYKRTGKHWSNAAFLRHKLPGPA